MLFNRYAVSDKLAQHWCCGIRINLDSLELATIQWIKGYRSSTKKRVPFRDPASFFTGLLAQWLRCCVSTAPHARQAFEATVHRRALQITYKDHIFVEGAFLSAPCILAVKPPKVTVARQCATVLPLSGLRARAFPGKGICQM